MRRYLAWWVETAWLVSRRPELASSILETAAPDPEVQADLLRGWSVVERVLSETEAT